MRTGTLFGATLLICLLSAAFAPQGSAVDQVRESFGRVREEFGQLRWYKLQETQFRKRAERFVDSWNRFAEDYNQGIISRRKALEAAELFHEMEKHPLWPKPEKQDVTQPGKHNN
jgi:hypothetical protein